MSTEYLLYRGIQSRAVCLHLDLTAGIRGVGVQLYYRADIGHLELLSIPQHICLWAFTLNFRALGTQLGGQLTRGYPVPEFLDKSYPLTFVTLPASHSFT